MEGRLEESPQQVRPAAVGEYLEIIDKEVAALHQHRGRPARLQPAQGEGQGAGGRSTAGRGHAVPPQAPQELPASSRSSGTLDPGLPEVLGERGAAHPGVHGAHAERGGRHGQGRHPYGPHRVAKRTGTTRSWSRSRTPASGFPARTCPRSSSRSTPPSRRAGAPGSASPSVTASSRTRRPDRGGERARPRVHVPDPPARAGEGRLGPCQH